MRHGSRLDAAPLSALIACGILVWSHARHLVDIVLSSARLPQWDMAKYAVSGQRLAESLAQLDLPRVLSELHGLSVWPPTYPLLEVPVLWIWGLDVSVLRLFQVSLWSAMVLATWWAMRRADRGVYGEVAGLVAASAVASMPLLAGLATVNMLEVPGLLLLALTLGAYLRARAADSYDSRRLWWRLTWLLTLALFLCKYNYGILWLLPLGLAEGRRWAGSWLALLNRPVEWLAARLEPRILLRPFPLFAATMLALIVAIRLTGGVDIEILGLEVRATSPGGPAQALYLALWLRCLLPWSRARLRWRRLSLLPLVPRLFVRCFALPAAIWMLPPPHLKDFLAFLENRDDGPPAGTWSWLTFYPRELLEAFGSPAFGLVLLVLALGWLVVGRGKNRGEALGVIPIGLAAWAAAILLHPYKLPCFAVFTWWWLALAAACGLGALLRVLAARRPRLALAFGLSLPLVGAWSGLDQERVYAEHLQRTVPAEAQDALEVIFQRTAVRGAAEADRASETPHVVVLGGWNLLSPHLLEWQARQRSLPRGWLESDFHLAGRSDHRLVRRLEEAQPPWVVLLDRHGDKAFGAEVEWLEPVRAWLLSGALYRQDEVIEAGGYRLRFFSPAAP